MADSKEQAIIDFLFTCPSIANNPVFFNFINAKNNTKQIITTANDKNINTPYIDGSVLKRFTFTIVDFKSITYNAIAMVSGYPDENVEDYLQVQQIIDWITEQDELGNYPDFGSECLIQEMRALTDNPNLNGIDTSTTPILAKYSVSIQVDYIDSSKIVWK